MKIAGDVFTNDIIYYMRTRHNLYIGETTAENIKINTGAAIEDIDSPPDPMLVQGRDLLTGKPKQVEISHREVAKALDKSILRIEDAIMETLSAARARCRYLQYRYLYGRRRLHAPWA